MEDKKNKPDQHETVSIHINKQQYHSPNPTTGSALYELGNVDPQQWDLVLEVPGKGDDIFISNNATPLEVKNGSHFYTSQKDLNPGA
jgi:hypothetical protein